MISLETQGGSNYNEPPDVPEVEAGAYLLNFVDVNIKVEFLSDLRLVKLSLKGTST